MYFYCVEFLEKSLYFLIIGIASAAGQREVDISVNGDHVVKTNIDSYTIYDSDFRFDRTLTISCYSYLPVPSIIYLVRNGAILNDTFADSTYTNRSAITKLAFNSNNVTYLEGAYSCRFNYSLHAYDGSQFEYFMEREIQINTKTESQGCASSVGFSGYFGEKVTLLCEDPSYSLHAGFFQGQWLRSQYSLQVNLLGSNIAFECFDKRYDDEMVCSHHFEVHPSLEIEITPKIFTLDSHVMEFSCNSTSPRMLYWELIGDDENIIELYNNDRLPQAGGSITIKQKAGWSSLRLSIMRKTDLGIRKVECYAYGTRTRSVAYATSLRPISITEAATRTDTVESSTSRTTPSEENWSPETLDSTTTTKPGLKEDSKATQDGGTESKMYESEGDTFVHIVVVAVSLILICSSTLLNIYMCYRVRRQPRSGEAVTKNNVQPKTELQDTSATSTYYTTTIQCNVDDKYEATYANTISLQS